MFGILEFLDFWLNFVFDGLFVGSVLCFYFGCCLYIVDMDVKFRGFNCI